MGKAGIPEEPYVNALLEIISFGLGSPSGCALHQMVVIDGEVEGLVERDDFRAGDQQGVPRPLLLDPLHKLTDHVTSEAGTLMIRMDCNVDDQEVQSLVADESGHADRLLMMTSNHSEWR